MTNRRNRVLYTGVTGNLARRAYEHQEKLVEGFTQKYNVTRLVYNEEHPDPQSAILREKQIKPGSRKKVQLIERLNPTWEDLYKALV